MGVALQEARKAIPKGEAPIGAVAVEAGKVIARAHNEREVKNDPLGHAEIILLKKLSRRFKDWRFPGVTVYLTLEPCPMCLGALAQARISRLVFGTKSPEAGKRPPFPIESGLRAEECSEILKRFFKGLRPKKKS